MVTSILLQDTIYCRLLIGRDGNPKPTIYRNLYKTTGAGHVFISFVI